jgi:hypothetical protein
MEHVTPEGEELDDWYWTDEAWFNLNGYVNTQNTRIWSAEKPHTLHEAPLHNQKVGVWTAASRKRVFLTFFEETVNSDRYMLLVQELFTALTDDEWEKTWFQQDNATAHTVRNTMAFLGRIMSQGLWPPRSPDLSPPNFFLWGHLKSVVYLKHPHTLAELRANIRHYVAIISRDTLRKVFRNTIGRVHLCESVDGSHFPHLL